MNEIKQLEFDYSSLPVDLGASLRLRGDRIVAVRNRAVYEIGKELCEAQQELANHKNGCFGEWVLSLGIGKSHGYELVSFYQNAGSDIVRLLDNKKLNQTVALFLTRSSTPDSVVSTVIEKAESGEKVTVEEVKRLKREAEIAKQNLDIAKIKIKELEARGPEQIVEKVEVVPEDYDHIKNKAALACDHADKLRKELEKVKKEFDQAVKAQVKANMDAVKKDVEIADARVVNRQKELEKIEAQLAKMNRSLADVEWHEEYIQKYFGILSNLSIDIGDMPFCKETSPRWMKLAMGFANAAKIIKLTMCDGKEFEEKFFDELSDSGSEVNS